MLRRAKNFLAVAMTVTVVFIAFSCCQSLRLYEVLVVHGPAGRPLVLASHRGVLYFAISDVPVRTFESGWVHDERWPAEGIDFLISNFIVVCDWQLGYRIINVAGGPAAGGSAWAEPKKCFGFSIAKGSNALNVPNTWWILGSAPAWFVGPLLAIYPLRRSFFWWRSRRRRLRGLCPVCAYDLRESSERCPECGIQSS